MVNAGVDWLLPLSAGNTMAHEMAHSIGVKHDAENGSTVEINCPNYKFLMGNAADAGGENGVWSNCSRQRYKELIDELDEVGNNCLLNKVRGGTKDNGGSFFTEKAHSTYR